MFLLWNLPFFKLVPPKTKLGEGNGTPLQYSYLENPMDRGAWWAAIYGVAQSRTRLKRLSSSSSNKPLFLKPWANNGSTNQFSSI